MKRLAIISLLAASGLLRPADACAQVASLGPVLIGSAGDFQINTSANISLSSSTGEPMVRTVSAQTIMFTEGFQQPEVSATFAMDMLVSGTGLLCNDANDGTAAASPTGGTPPYQYELFSSSSVLLQTAAAQTSGYTFGNLAPGTYTIVGTDNNGFVKVDTVIVNDNTEPCGVIIYKGLTPNGDGKNDLWVIDFIDLFTPNSVSIFDRWGTMVWNGTDYDNVNTVFAGKNTSGAELPDGTYFYIVRYDGKTRKGWLELSR